MNIAQSILNSALHIGTRMRPPKFRGAHPKTSQCLPNLRWHEFHAREDRCRLNAWTANPGHPSGTVFLLHGFRENCCGEWLVYLGEQFANRLNLAVMALDFRGHGQSEKRIPTFGVGESWDISGAMDLAERLGFPKPFLLHGASMGAMGAQICAVTDHRVTGAFLMCTPASAQVAIRSLPRRLHWLTQQLINAAYGFDVVSMGDVKAYPPSPAHEPKLFFVMGDCDHFGYPETVSTFGHWYKGEPCQLELPPAGAPCQKKWFVTARGAGHELKPAHYPNMSSDVEQFFTQLCALGGL